MHTKTTINRLLACSLIAGLPLALTACSGHGKYTTEGISLAKTRLDSLKAATEYDMAMQAFLAGDLEKAGRKVDQAERLTPDNPKAAVLRGRIAIERGLMGEALIALQRAVELNKEEIEAHYYLGVVNERLNEHDAALTHFTRAHELEPFNPQHAVAAGEMLIDLDRTDEARTFLTASESSKHSAGIQQLLGHIELIDEDPESACERFGRARLLAPEDAAILTDLASAQMAAGRFGHALTNLDHLLADPENEGRRDLQHLKAECLLALGRTVDAREIYRDLTAREGASDVRAWAGLARTAFQIKDERSFRRAATRVLSIDPAYGEGYVLHAALQREQGNHAKALQILDTGLMRAGRDADLLAMRSLVLSELGRRDEALVAAQAALDLDPTNQAGLRMLDRLAVVSVPVD